MYTSLRLQHFRNYTDQAFELSPQVNVVVGLNGSGKTNLLEAILVLSQGVSYRAPDRELLEHNKTWSRLDGVLKDGSERIWKLDYRHDRPQKSFIIGGSALKRLTLHRALPVALFEPEHMRLLTGQPEIRREFIDTILEQTVPGFRTTRLNYRRALSQRNRLLKQGVSDLDHLFVWNVRLSELGALIATQRALLVDRMNATIGTVYSSIADNVTKLEVIYHSTTSLHDYASHLLKDLEKHTARDIERGFTSVGPHRDDLRFLIGGHDSEFSASRGETRTIILSCKLIELQVLEEAYDKRPIVLLDDVFSELDSTRRAALAQYLQDYQTIITTTDADTVKSKSLKTGQRITLSA